MTDRRGWDEVQDDPSWIDPVLQARNAEDRIVHVLRERGLVRSEPARHSWVLRLARPVAFAAAIVIAFAVGTRLHPRDDAPPEVPGARGVPTTLPELGPQGEVKAVAFHLADPLDQDGPLGAKPFHEASHAPYRESSPAFHLLHPFDSDEPDEITPISAKPVQLAAGP